MDEGSVGNPLDDFGHDKGMATLGGQLSHPEAGLRDTGDGGPQPGDPSSLAEVDSKIGGRLDVNLGGPRENDGQITSSASVDSPLASKPLFMSSNPLPPLDHGHRSTLSGALAESNIGSAGMVDPGSMQDSMVDPGSMQDSNFRAPPSMPHSGFSLGNVSMHPSGLGVGGPLGPVHGQPQSAGDNQATQLPSIQQFQQMASVSLGAMNTPMHDSAGSSMRGAGDINSSGAVNASSSSTQPVLEVNREIKSTPAVVSATPPVYTGGTRAEVGTVKDVLSSLMKSQKGKTRVTKLTRRRKRGPQPPLSAVTYFRFDTLPEVCKRNPGSSPEEIILIVENKWQLLEQERKKVYLDKAKEDQKRYDNEIKLYLPKSQGGRMKRAKAKKHPNAPKHPKSAYLYFVAEHRQRVKKQYPGKGFTEIAQKLGEQWRALTPDQMEKYKAQATADKERYRREKEEFQPPPTDMTTEKKDSAKRRKKHPLAPKHPLSAYLFFVATNRPRMNEKYPDKDFTEVARMLGQQWKSLPTQERRIFEILAFADKKRYLEEKDRWIPPHQKQHEPKRRKKNSELDGDQLFSDWMYPNDSLDTSNTGGGHMGTHGGGGQMNPDIMIGHHWQQPMMPMPGAEMHQDIMYPPPPPQSLGGYMYRSVKQTRYDSGVEVLKWGAMEVARFISCVGLPNFQNAFMQSGIDGKQFIQLSQLDLRQRFGVEGIGDRKKIMKAIQILMQG